MVKSIDEGGINVVDDECVAEVCMNNGSVPDRVITVAEMLCKCWVQMNPIKYTYPSLI
jgi:hypothetical protein